MQLKLMPLAVILVFLTTCISQESFAQSGSRSGGGSNGAARSGGARSGGSSARSASGNFSSGRRLSAGELALLRSQQAIRQQELAKALEAQQMELAQVQYKQYLIELGARPNGGENRKQYNLAFAEAKDNFRALREGKVKPDELGILQRPFRLRRDAIDRDRQIAKWPTFLKSTEFESLVRMIDTRIMDGSIVDTPSAEACLGDLEKLDLALNVAAINGNVGATQYARSARFIAGLANEIRASNLLM